EWGKPNGPRCLDTTRFVRPADHDWVAIPGAWHGKATWLSVLWPPKQQGAGPRGFRHALQQEGLCRLLGRVLINRQPKADLRRPMSVVGGKADIFSARLGSGQGNLRRLRAQ